MQATFESLVNTFILDLSLYLYIHFVFSVRVRIGLVWIDNHRNYFRLHWRKSEDKVNKFLLFLW